MLAARRKNSSQKPLDVKQIILPNTNRKEYGCAEYSIYAMNCENVYRVTIHLISFLCSLLWNSTHTHTHTNTHKLKAIFPGEPWLASCPLNSPSLFIAGLCILLGHPIFHTTTEHYLRFSRILL